MKSVTVTEMQQIDKKAIVKYGIPALILMENAAIASAFCALKMLKRGKKKVSIFCGGGNNGGDGFACARHLINRGLDVRVYFLGRKNKLPKEAKINYQIMQKLGQKIEPFRATSLKRRLQDTDLIIDALLGIGLKRSIREPTLSAIELLNITKKPILSLDIPSGLDATTGEIHGIAICAQCTVTFGMLKKGLLNLEAKKYTGKVIVGDISLPRQLYT